MNKRNLLFVIVLFLVWAAGYYYYSPKKNSSQPPIPDIALSPEETLWQENVHVPVQQKAETTDVVQPVHLEEPQKEEQAVIEQPTEDIKPVAVAVPKKKKKKRSKKTRESIPQATQHVVTPIAQPASQTHPQLSSLLSPDSSAKSTITIASNLVKKDIGYYKMFSWHYPYLFSLTVNGQPLFTKQDKTITQAEVQVPADQPFVVRYSYEWHTPWGKRIGAKKVTFNPNPDEQNLSVSFISNWKNEERITVDGASKISAELLEEETAP